MIGKNHHSFLFGKERAFREAISRAAYFDGDCPDLIGPEKGDVLNEFRGTAILSMLSYFEEVVTDVYNPYRNFNPTTPVSPRPRVKLIEYLNQVCGNWDGWYEIYGLMRIRHCFAHSAGRILISQRPHLHSFEEWLKNGNALNVKGQPLKPYFEIDVSNRIRLEDSALYRCRIIVLYALNHCGFIGPLKLYELWK